MITQNNLLSFSITWFVTGSVFLMNVQLGKSYVQRDTVDHAAAMAADVAMKTYCDGDNGADRAAVAPVLDMVGSATDCSVTTMETGINGAGGRELDTAVKCRFKCSIPIASQVMCTQGHVTFEKHRHTVAMGCDAN
jgi:hypothetical protein